MGRRIELAGGMFMVEADRLAVRKRGHLGGIKPKHVISSKIIYVTPEKGDGRKFFFN